MVRLLLDEEEHNYSATLTGEITFYYKKLAEDKTTEICTLSKETWRCLGDKEKCKEWIDKITDV